MVAKISKDSGGIIYNTKQTFSQLSPLAPILLLLCFGVCCCFILDSRTSPRRLIPLFYGIMHGAFERAEDGR